MDRGAKQTIYKGSLEISTVRVPPTDPASHLFPFFFLSLLTSVFENPIESNLMNKRENKNNRRRLNEQREIQRLLSLELFFSF